jgi:hypothetical protein
MELVCAEFLFDEAAPGGPVQLAVVSGRLRICGGGWGEERGWVSRKRIFFFSAPSYSQPSTVRLPTTVPSLRLILLLLTSISPNPPISPARPTQTSPLAPENKSQSATDTPPKTLRTIEHVTYAPIACPDIRPDAVITIPRPCVKRVEGRLNAGTYKP